jgi:hypothetical protein
MLHPHPNPLPSRERGIDKRLKTKNQKHGQKREYRIG